MWWSGSADMRDEKFLVFDLFFSLFENEWKRENLSDLVENERQNLFFNSKQKKQKFCPDCFFCSKEQKVSLFRSKIQKNSKRIFFTTDRERKQRKNSKKKKSVGERNTLLCCADLYSPLSLKIKCSRLREEGLPLRNEEDIEAFSEVVLSPLKKKQTTF